MLCISVSRSSTTLLPVAERVEFCLCNPKLPSFLVSQKRLSELEVLDALGKSSPSESLRANDCEDVPERDDAEVGGRAEGSCAASTDGGKIRGARKELDVGNCLNGGGVGNEKGEEGSKPELGGAVPDCEPP